MGFSFHFSSLYPAPCNELYVCEPIQISYLNFRAVLVLPKTAGSTQTHKSMISIWIVWSDDPLKATKVNSKMQHKKEKKLKF